MIVMVNHVFVCVVLCMCVVLFSEMCPNFIIIGGLGCAPLFKYEDECEKLSLTAAGEFSYEDYTEDWSSVNKKNICLYRRFFDTFR
jgi:hypothetical protein